MKQKVAVIGAGLTGLTTAYYLRKKGIDVTVFEKADRPGGVIQTYRKDGFTYENGPSTGVLGTPEAAELIAELGDLCKLEIADEDAKYRWIWKGGRWVALPSGLLGGITTPLFRLADKLRLLGEPFRKPGTNPNESLASLVRRRMGESFLNYAVDPFILGIYSGDPERLVTKYALPKLYHLEQKYGSFIGGAIKKAKEPKSERDKKATREVFSLRGGLSTLIDALVHRIGPERIVLNAENMRVALAGKSYMVSYNDQPAGRFDQLISTVGAWALPELLPFLPKKELVDIIQLPYAKVVQVSVGFRKWEGISLKAFGGLVPFCENRRVLGALFLSSFLQNRAPEGGALISTFLGGVRRSNMVELSDEEIKSIVEAELKEMLGLTKWNPDLLVINRYQHAIPQYGVESEAKLEAVTKLQERFSGLHLAGNLRDGIGMADRIRQGCELAALIE
ncbi:protoporphyrinogen oxidase [Mangrovibacterium marinum]|uniref:Coproporphyrinogen III oxidase n=1 Tax=Mangrovibacterium marinum TaxID=1639118 RepID=A0A2T5BZU2_9BACT|nr:protoporphyrinogen oxidase [Mangrovibacterium marinum]PTN07812.1 oxygen-dependent protoporphyrinogen oxidase [Mangrovibacterium marinum]